MLYDPKWEKPATVKKPSRVSIEGLIEWLEGQNPATRYSYGNIHDCLLTRYFKAVGFRWAYCGATRFSYSRFFLPPLFSKAIPEEMDSVAVEGAWTYGAALERARTLR